MTTGTRPRLIGVVAVGIVVLGLLAEWLAHGVRFDFDAQRDLFTGWLIAGSGVVAWGWVPRSRVGPLLVLAGLAWFIGTPGDRVTDIGRLALSLRFVYAGVMAHAIYTWPEGHLRGNLDRVLIAGGYLLTLFPPLWERDTGLMVIAALFSAGLLAQSLTAPARTRRVRRPALVIGIGLAVLLAAKGAIGTFLSESGIAYPSQPEALWQIALVAGAGALAGSLIRLERRREAATDLVVRLSEVGTLASVAELAEATGLPDDAVASEAFARAETISVRNAALRDELTGQAVALEASRRRLLEAEDDEREALEARLRGGVDARLARLEVVLSGHRAAIEPVPGEAGTRVARALEQLRLARIELGELAHGLDPALLRERGLSEALADLAASSPVPVELALGPLEPQDRSIERAFYFVAAEALANVAKHAGATRAWMRLGTEAQAVVLSVEDDGAGGAEPALGSGLRGLIDRVESVGGALRITPRPEGGTCLRALVPRSSSASPH